MTSDKKIFKLILVPLFISIGIGALCGSIYLIWITAFGIGWGGGKATLLDIVWKWKGFLLISIYSFIASIGLMKNSKTGIIFGYTISVGFLIYFIADYGAFGWNGESQISISDLIWTTLLLGLPIFMFYGLSKIKKTLTEFKLTEYLAIGVLIILLFLAFHFMFS